MSSATSAANRAGANSPGIAEAGGDDVGDAAFGREETWYCLITRGPNHGRPISGKRTRSSRGRESGRAGEIRVRVRISSGRVAATLTQTAPPRELPIRCTGPRFCFSISAMTVCARAAIE